MNLPHVPILASLDSCFLAYIVDVFRMAMYTGVCSSYILTEPPDGLWGGELNGTWNGLVGVLQRKVSDPISNRCIQRNSKHSCLYDTLLLLWKTEILPGLRVDW